MSIIGSLGGVVRIVTRRKMATVQEVIACQMSSKICMSIPSCFKIKCDSLTHVHYTWEMECILHRHIHSHTEVMTVT